MKLIHFSDIHTGGHLSTFKALFDKRIIGTINYKLRRQKYIHWEYLEKALEVIDKEKPDYVINTGDITSVSAIGEFKEASERLTPLVENNSFTFLNVPGNHDYYIDNPVNLKAKIDTYNFLNRRKFKIEDLPHKIESEEAIFILVDESRPNSGTQSSGFFDEKNYQKINQWLKDSPQKPVILIGHYPLRDKIGNPLSQRRSLENSEALFTMLENGRINVTLCGHIHAAFSREEDSGSLEICSGSLTIGGKMNKLEFDKSTGKFSQSWIDLR
ncbi:MAG: metallophosphoesterase [Lentisphaerales bacterium]|nr:metallophosphoesterase [Lentisphaerales bacterium]